MADLVVKAIIEARRRPATREDRRRRYRSMRGWPFFEPAAVAWRKSAMSLQERLAEGMRGHNALFRHLSEAKHG